MKKYNTSPIAKDLLEQNIDGEILTKIYNKLSLEIHEYTRELDDFTFLLSFLLSSPLLPSLEDAWAPSHWSLAGAVTI